MSNGHTKERIWVTFFSVFYLAIGVGAFLSMLLSPLLRANVSYAVTFGMPSLPIGFSIIIFWAGRGSFVDRQAVGISVFSTVVKVIFNDVRLGKNKSGSVNYEQVNCSAKSSSTAHWLDTAKLRCGVGDVKDVKALMRVCVVLYIGACIIKRPLLGYSRQAKWMGMCPGKYCHKARSDAIRCR